ncbi:MAG TPA: hypothetical protein VFR44_07475 [Actinomycetota bacterium]|nr:hypothetical protein [Actinomycetota bacterium]
MATTMAKRRSKRRSGSDLAVIGAIAAAVVFVVALAAVFATSAGGGGSTAVGGSGEVAAATDAGALAPTGEVNDMGLPVYETPGYASGSARASGVTVQGADWAMGQVPLDIAVRPFWTLTNTGTTEVRLGQPEAQVREGCCPGPFALGATRLAPGDSTWLTFELAMHEGMDGWHDMGVVVPIEGAGGPEVLELNVTGDFRN